MASITIKNIPDDIHQRLVAKAKNNGRSLNQEVILSLRQAACEAPRNVEEQLLEVREHHRQLQTAGVWITPEEVQAAKIAGRK
jgi:plasmid stability protein